MIQKECGEGSDEEATSMWENTVAVRLLNWGSVCPLVICTCACATVLHIQWMECGVV